MIHGMLERTDAVQRGQKNMSMAIITGASSGLGMDYALEVYRQHPEIEEIVLIARRRERLEALAEKLSGRRVTVLALDLTKRESREEIAAFLAEKSGAANPVRLLINNAGFGWMGNVGEGDAELQADMVQLNCGALTALCALTLPYMKKGSVIVNVCSIAAFVPTPRMTVYCSTKAYVLSFSKSLREETKKQGINVLAVCPAPMDTEFLSIAGIEGKSKTFDMLPRVKSAEVAKKSLRKAFAGRAVYTNRVIYKLYRVLGKLLPHNWLMGIATV